MIGVIAIYLTFAWLLSAIAASWLSDRKGYGERVGLASGLLLNVLGVVVWLAWPAKEASRWKVHGPFGRGEGKTVAEVRAEGAARSERSADSEAGDQRDA